MLYFWLGANEAFEGPKTQATLFYGLALLAVSAPWLAERLPAAWARHRAPLLFGAALVLAVLASLAAGAVLLPGNQALSAERCLPVLLAAFGGLIFLLEDPDGRDRLLFIHMTAHLGLLFYGLIQLLDQTWGAAHGVSVDLIRWVHFGETRVYSTLGNPDYMAAHLTLVAGLWLGLGWRRLPIKGAAQTAAAALLAAPLLLVPMVYGAAALGGFVGSMGPWLAVCALLFLGARLLPARLVWALCLAVLGTLVLLAQGRGAWLATLAAAVALSAAAWRLDGFGFFQRRWNLLRWPLGLALAGILVTGALLAGRAAQPKAAWASQGFPGKVLGTVDSLGYRVVHIFDAQDEAQVVRRLYWKAAWNLGLAHPLFGIGYGNHALYTAKAQSEVWKAWDAAGDPRAMMVEPHVELYTHNDYLQNFAETGLVGLAAFLAFWAFFVRKAWSLARAGAGRDDRRLELGLGLLGLAVAFGVNALSNFPWRVLATQQLCWLAFALVAAETAQADVGPLEGIAPAVQPAEFKLPAWGWAATALMAACLAMVPLRWFNASILFKQGNARKDDPNPQIQVQGIPFYETAVKAGLSGTQQVELYLYLGSLYNLQGRSDLAEQWFNQGLRRYPDFLEARYNLGFTYQNRYAASHTPSDLATAIDDYQRVLDVDPRSSNALNNLGNLRYQQGDLAGADALYGRLLRYSPDSLEARYNLAAVAVRQGKNAEAKALLEQAVAQKPDFAQAVQLLKQLKQLPPGH
ncbi:MAG TPA: O-antigen ligase family protein [bacterium]|nr:O-antigen ligase family protein [bacterium]